MLDIARIIGAARGVSKHHRILRRQQLDIHGRTSSIIKILRTRGPQPAKEHLNIHESDSNSAARPSRSTEDVNKSPIGTIKDPAKHVSHESPNSQAFKDAIPGSSLNANQAAADEVTLPDGTSLPGDSRAARELYQKGLSQPISQEAPSVGQPKQVEHEAEPSGPSTVRENSIFTMHQDKAMSFAKSPSQRPVPSSIPLTKTPEHSGNTKARVDRTPEGTIDEDVSYASKAASKASSISADTKDGLGEEVYTQLFHSRNVAGKLTGQHSPYGLGKGKPQRQPQVMPTDNRHPLDTRPIPQEETEKHVVENVAQPSAVSGLGLLHTRC